MFWKTADEASIAGYYMSAGVDADVAWQTARYDRASRLRYRLEILIKRK